MKKENVIVQTDNLHYYSPNDLKDILQDQRENFGWDLNDERQFVENLLSQRFNFMLVVFSLFMTAAITAKNPEVSFGVLSVGVVFQLMQLFTIRRVYEKLDVNLIILHNVPGHPFEIIKNEMAGRNKKSGLMGSVFNASVNHWVGIYIPWFCVLIQVIGLVVLTRY